MIPHALSGLTFIERFYSFPTLASTNDTARSLKHRPEKGMFCIQADSQTAGKGRRGGSFFSESVHGLWVSLVAPLKDHHFVYNRAISLAIAMTLEQCGSQHPVSIKWPNDIYWGGRKACGILLENHSCFQDVIIIGFGINVNTGEEEFPPELRTIATSVLIETGKKCSLSALLRTILKQFSVILSSDQNIAHALYSERLYGKGETIGINGLKGIFSSVEPDGRLKLINNGIPVMIYSGSPVFLEK